jgi:hypothetical protein
MVLFSLLHQIYVPSGVFALGSERRDEVLENEQEISPVHVKLPAQYDPVKLKQ